MTWITWRQLRAQVLVVYAALAAVAAALAITGPQLADLRRTNPADFLVLFPQDGTYKPLYFVGGAVVYALPVVIGAFWGAPLVARELETGTHRVVWNQSITRNRWLATKLGLAGLAALVAGLISLAVTWWCAPIDAAVNSTEPDGGFFNITRMSAVLFGARGVVPIGYAVLAFVIGVTAGLVLRRTVPAMAATVVAVVAIQVATPLFVVPHLISPERLTTAITATNLRGMSLSADDDMVTDIRINLDKPGAWILSNETVNSSGQVVDELPAHEADCAPRTGELADKASSPGPPASCFEDLAAAGFQQEVVYQPADRYWLLQSIQTAILLSLAVLLSGFCFWRIRRDFT
ncbi:hypothetical protein [Nocardioides speluncae]|uniref:hypothetical protein n=1 Tax=Nocardioides speluncae TaxID=2670337 RepID=UPI000D6894B7|nr:hypothetical protein [Nocardioides speluncae]